MLNIAIVYYSGYGHTKFIAEKIKNGIEKEEIKCKIYDAETCEDGQSAIFNELSEADCIIFGSPTYMGSCSAGLKSFMDYSSKIWFNQGWKDKFAAGFTVSGQYCGGKELTMMQICNFAAQHSMIWISQGIISQGKSDQDINRLGSFLGLMIQANHGSPETSIPSGDIETAEMFGQRITKVVKEMLSKKLRNDK